MTQARPACAPPASRSIVAGYRYSSLVYLVGRLQHGIRLHPLPLLQPAVETALAPGMTGDAALLFHLQQNHVAVAIEAYLFHLLDMARLFALVPQFLARARPVYRLALLPGQAQCLAIHPRHHQHAACRRILRDGGNQTVRSEEHTSELQSPKDLVCR